MTSSEHKIIDLDDLCKLDELFCLALIAKTFVGAKQNPVQIMATRVQFQPQFQFSALISIGLTRKLGARAVSRKTPIYFINIIV